jgi:hypothetical protein
LISIDFNISCISKAKGLIALGLHMDCIWQSKDIYFLA